ncbi:hypothetical protein NDU88_006898 [Pleurodeles waltl]|uniref:Uncharacterized protein n=1 Tax=Pleurodeles waltl TaxID=8319 RepID=A0AAV7UMD6_PLEWA|nr:hypothetical protein NDU88_006898 [Pleurodeles waltl]
MGVQGVLVTGDEPGSLWLPTMQKEVEERPQMVAEVLQHNCNPFALLDLDRGSDTGMLALDGLQMIGPTLTPRLADEIH